MQKQNRIAYIEEFPSVITNLILPDWKKKAKEYFDIIFDPERKGSDMPLCRIFPVNGRTKGGYEGKAFGIPSYVGIKAEEKYGEALTCLGAVLGALCAGEEGKRGENNFLEMAGVYYSIAGGRPVVLNNVHEKEADCCGSFWYDIFPSILYMQIASFTEPGSTLRKQAVEIAKTWGTVAAEMKGDWFHTGYSIQDKKTLDSGRWIEPDAPVGIAYLTYIGYCISGRQELLDAAKKCLDDFEGMEFNPYYEILGSFGPYVTARMNAECGTNYDLTKSLKMVFSPTSAVRTGWGIIGDKWGDYYACGLSGSSTDTCGYAFSMNTFVTAAAVAPLVRYEAGYARSIGKYLLNVYYNSALFYPDTLPADMQSNADWAKQTGVNCIAYEGVRNKGITTPYSTGDAKKNFNPYGAWSVGLLAGMYRTSGKEGVIIADLKAVEFYAPESFQTYLIYNGNSEEESIDLALPEGRFTIYDACEHTVLTKDAAHEAVISIGAEEARVLVLVPAELELREERRSLVSDEACAAQMLTAGGIPVDFCGDHRISQSGQDVTEVYEDKALRACVSASSEFSEKYGAACAINGDWHDWWMSKEGSGSAWLLLDLGRQVRCSLLNLYWCGTDNLSCAKRFTVELSSDNSQWTAAERVEDNGSYYNFIRLNGAECRYIRLTLEEKEKDDPEACYGIYDIQVF